VPADKSISHRAVMLGAIAHGRSVIRNWLPAGDTIATLNAIQKLGIQVNVGSQSINAWDLTIEGQGLNGLKMPEQPINCQNAGTCMRLLAGILAGQNFPSVLDGSPQLQKRPMGRIISPLRMMGAKISSKHDRAPLHIQPADLHGIRYQMKVASAQVKSAILLAGLYSRETIQVYQPGPARDHTERMLAAMGADITVEDNWVSLQGGQPLSPLDLTVPGDISSAAFPLIAASIIPHSLITVTNIGYNKTRTGIVDMMTSMGAKLKIDNQRITGGEPAADFTFHFEELHNASFGGDIIVRAIDEFPIWAVAATQAAGESSVRDAAELRVKEVDRISILVGELSKMGAAIIEHPDGFTVTGPTLLNYAEVDSHGDHRLGMALAIAGLATNGPTLIHNADCISDSFPGFVETMQSLGADMEWTE